MDRTVLLATFIVELTLWMLRFISMHLRSLAERRRLARLPTWELLPFSFKIDYFSNSDDKVINLTKSKKPRSRRV